MQFSVALLGAALTIGAGSLAVADYSSYPPETAPAVELASLYLIDDNAAAGAVRLRLDKVGYAGAEKVFEPALRRDPASGTRWVDVGEAFFALGDRKNAEYCYLQAASVAPNDPVTLLAVGDFYFNLKDPARATPYFSRILRVSTHEEEAILIQNVFGYLEQMHVRQLNLLDDSIPDARTARLYLAYLMARTDTNSVRSIWRWMREKHFDDDASTIAYIAWLFDRKKDYAAAAEDWGIFASVRHDGYPARTAVFNGGFEYAPLAIRFDWGFDGLKGVTATRDSAVHHDGSYSMRLDFTGNDNPDFQHFKEMVFVTPGRYRLEAFLRTSAITSAEGLRLRVQGTGVQAQTDALTGTNDWTPVGVTFDVPAGTNFVEVQFARRLAVRVDNQLTGTGWLDSVSLTRLH